MVEIRFTDRDVLSNAEKNLWKFALKINSFNVYPLCGYKAIVIRSDWEYAREAEKLFRHLLECDVMDIKEFDMIDAFEALTGSEDATRVMHDVWWKERERRKRDDAERRAFEVFKAHEIGQDSPEIDMELLKAVSSKSREYYRNKPQSKLNRNYEYESGLRDIFLLGYEMAKREMCEGVR